MPVLAVGGGGGEGEERTLILGLSVDDISNLINGVPLRGSLDRALGIPVKLLVLAGPTDKDIRGAISEVVPRTTTLSKDATAEDVTKFLKNDNE